MSARATRGPDAGTVGKAAACRFGAGAIAGGRMADFRGLGASCCTNHSRKVSSEIITPIFSSDSTMMRTDVPVLRSFKRTARNRVSSSALVILQALASVMSAANLRASSCGGSWDMAGKVLGNYSAITCRSQGKHQRPNGKKTKRNRLDVGVSKKLKESC